VRTTFRLGGELEVRRLGFGAMRVVHEPVEGAGVLRRAVELGVNFIDTADIDGAGASEELIAKALHPYPADLVIATKGGLGWGLQERIRDGRPEHLRLAVEASLRRLRLERIDPYQLHRHDPEVPLEESVGALAELRREGKIRSRERPASPISRRTCAPQCGSPIDCAGLSWLDRDRRKNSTVPT
jgi:aryl-alcohol dehydrogenase-like predicted oxidoreductase